VWRTRSARRMRAMKYIARDEESLLGSARVSGLSDFAFGEWIE
jgi:hypothetical protein